jgi:hypothetical protein
MAWVVKGWRMDALERLLAEDARASVHAARADADRDARRARRAADRTAAEAAAQLEALEGLGVELRESVRRARAACRPDGPAAADAPAAPEAVPPLVAVSDVPAARPRRRERASLHSSALGELFRATAAS